MEQVKEPGKEDREHVLAMACRIMAGVSPVAAADSQTQHPFPTPSPFSFSGTSSRWSSRPPIDHSTLFLRFLLLLFSFISALSLAAPSTKKKGQRPPSFTQYPELIYCFIVAILAFLYAAFQLFKGICDIAHRGILISDKTSDYLSFVLDQLAGYLLISSSSVAIPIIRQVEKSTPVWKGTIISTSMSFATFLVIAICALFSGYKLCKRNVW
ncbi:LOW QUALITY PROTEIN: CASP-like protein 4A4 [Herrania umbratica]|uniref:CASP-like protein n=1 Tax=Herrania umbratica TaxID=108875 RepID=A0A6J1BMS3_9ROSI|nr:LOW QUALITY PROTEIN: CASP-like protein 4A4 [Herrania umbratica]